MMQPYKCVCVCVIGIKVKGHDKYVIILLQKNRCPTKLSHANEIDLPYSWKFSWSKKICGLIKIIGVNLKFFCIKHENHEI